VPVPLFDVVADSGPRQLALALLAGEPLAVEPLAVEPPLALEPPPALEPPLPLPRIESSALTAS